MKAQIRNIINSAFGKMQDLKTDVTIKHLEKQEWDDSTGKSENVYGNYDVEVYLSHFDNKMVDGLTIQFDDRKVYLPASQIDFEPKAGDDSITINGTNYNIEMVQSKFGELYILKI